MGLRGGLTGTYDSVQGSGSQVAGAVQRDSHRRAAGASPPAQGHLARSATPTHSTCLYYCHDNEAIKCALGPSLLDPAARRLRPTVPSRGGVGGAAALAVAERAAAQPPQLSRRLTHAPRRPEPRRRRRGARQHRRPGCAADPPSPPVQDHLARSALDPSQPNLPSPLATRLVLVFPSTVRSRPLPPA